MGLASGTMTEDGIVVPEFRFVLGCKGLSFRSCKVVTLDLVPWDDDLTASVMTQGTFPVSVFKEGCCGDNFLLNRFRDWR